jgi:rhamnulokinase
MKKLQIIGVDIGASSGRVMLGKYDGKTLNYEEFHRFPNGAVSIHRRLYWNLLGIYNEILKGLQKISKSGYIQLQSIGIDTWGVDYGLLSSNGEIVGNVYHYRDPRSSNAMEEVFKIIPKEYLYRITGAHFSYYNTIYQLYAAKKETTETLTQANTLLMIPDLLNYLLTGLKVSEYSVTSTTQLLEVGTTKWSSRLIELLEFPSRLFTPIVNSGTFLGKCVPTFEEESGIRNLNVITTVSHDSAAAVVATPTERKDFIYLICGTWSIIGTELDSPHISEKALVKNFTNEGGTHGKIRFLKNVTCLWILQECIREWEKQDKHKMNYPQLFRLAAEAPSFSFYMDPDDELFIRPGNMPERIKKYCLMKGQAPPREKGTIIRGILESIAKKYKDVVQELEDIVGICYPIIHMLGGGSMNSILCQLTANATGKTVISGPSEATVIGNLAMQLEAVGELNGLNQIRGLVCSSEKLTYYEPNDELRKCFR